MTAPSIDRATETDTVWTATKGPTISAARPKTMFPRCAHITQAELSPDARRSFCSRFAASSVVC
jgi:hypothetical protein